MTRYDLDDSLLDFPSASGGNRWTLRDAFEGLQIFGGIGSGKTSGSGRMLALKFLKKGFGGLVLTVKPDEKAQWQSYCQQVGREHDLIVLEPGGRLAFNFLDYVSKPGATGSSITANIVDVLKTVIRAGEAKEKGGSDDAFWESALDMLIYNVIDLCKIAYSSLSVQMMYDIVQSIPKAEDKLQAKEEKLRPFQAAFERARQNVASQVDDYFNTLTYAERQRLCDDDDAFEQVMLDNLPDARTLRFLDQFFLDSFKNLSSKTRSIIDFTFAGFLFRLLRDPVYSLFCKGRSSVVPDDSLSGKIILLALPVKVYHKVGRDCQILFKYIWQRAMEQRSVDGNSRPVFLWADEAQNFLHEHDAEYQATARSSRIATVYISQNLPNYYAAMGGDKGDYRVKSFLGTLGTKIFHANADIETNKYASDLIGDALMTNPSMSVTMGADPSASNTIALQVDKCVRPEKFVSLRTGGPRNGYKVEGYVHKQGDCIVEGRNYLKMTFNQNILV